MPAVVEVLFQRGTKIATPARIVAATQRLS
jgi:hypothetical protein